MKQLIKKTFLFTFKLLFLIGLSYCFILIRLHYNTDGLKIGQENNKIFVGDSHIQKSMKDALYPGAVNTAYQSETMYHSYHKVYNLIAHNEQIDTVFLGLDYHSFSNIYDVYLYIDYLNSKLIFFYPYRIQYALVRNSEHPFKLLFKSIYHGFNCIILRNENLLIDDFNDEYLGELIDKVYVDSRIKIHFYENENERAISTFQIEQAQKINDFCKEKKIELIVLNIPTHEWYKNSIPEKFKKAYYSFIESNQLTVFDFEGISTEKSDFLPDGDHLTLKGAEKATLFLKENINRK